MGTKTQSPPVVYVAIGDELRDSMIQAADHLVQGLADAGLLPGLDLRTQGGSQLGRMWLAKEYDFVAFAQPDLDGDGSAGTIHLGGTSWQPLDTVSPLQPMIDLARVLVNTRAVVVSTDGSTACPRHWLSVFASQAGWPVVRYNELAGTWDLLAPRGWAAERERRNMRRGVGVPAVLTFLASGAMPDVNQES